MAILQTALNRGQMKSGIRITVAPAYRLVGNFVERLRRQLEMLFLGVFDFVMT